MATLTALDPVEILWGERLRVQAQATRPYSCASGLPASVPFTLRASGSTIETTPLSGPSFVTCSGDVLTAQWLSGSPGGLPFGTYALIADFGPPFSVSSLALVVRVNPEFSFVIPGGQGVMKASMGARAEPRITTTSCTGRGALLQDRTTLGVLVPPANMRFPYEHVFLSASGCTTPDAFMLRQPTRVPVLLEFPDAIPPDAVIWVYETSRDRPAPQWKPIVADFNGKQASLVLTGGGANPSFDNFVQAIVALAVPQPISMDFALQDLWWGSAEGAGWGLNIAKNEDRLFTTLFIYDDAGKPQWVVMPSGTWDPVHRVYYGDLFIPTGSAYSAYNNERFAMGDPVGKGSLSFVTEDDGYFDYIVRGTAGGQRLVRYKFAPRGTTAPQYAGMWWGGAGQDGWGVSIQQQGQTLFATWYTYGADGKVTWFYMPGGSFTSPTTYAGTLYRTTSGPWLGVNYNTANLKVIAVGTLRLDFASPNAATMTSIVDGVTLARPLKRFDF